ncbi:hypothetical protein EZS27_009649 [termite gut metagenome]|uniref:Uncharacterized protein n=1 Tax=termite gut metagenome TaxID=433724 RepID=A0A5J4S8Z0_9ZZZZ
MIQLINKLNNKNINNLKTCIYKLYFISNTFLYSCTLAIGKMKGYCDFHIQK